MENTSHPRPLRLQSLLSLAVIALTLPVLVLYNQYPTNWFNHAAQPPHPVDSPVTKKVLVINFDPLVASKGNAPLNVAMGWSDPTTLDQTYISDVRTTSGNYVNYQIVQTITVNAYPVKQDGFTYTESSYLACVSSGGTNCHSPDLVNYNKILNDYNVCSLRNSGLIDELWLWGAPWFGYWEAVMAGPNAFFTNAAPITDSSCQKQLNIMGFSYERGPSEMIEDLGHRVEGTMAYLNSVPIPSQYNLGYINNDWVKFFAYDNLFPGKSGCGWIHYAPNSTSAYDWSNTRIVNSSCGDWYNYPNLTGSTQPINCSAWNCDGYQYKKWWLSHLPRYQGLTHGVWNNWWKYVLDYEGSIASLPTPTPTSTPTPSCVPLPPCLYSTPRCTIPIRGDVNYCPVPSPTPTYHPLPTPIPTGVPSPTPRPSPTATPIPVPTPSATSAPTPPPPPTPNVTPAPIPTPTNCSISCGTVVISGTCSQSSPCKLSSQYQQSTPNATYSINTNGGCSAQLKSGSLVVDTSTNPFNGNATPPNTWLSAATFRNSTTSNTWNFCYALYGGVCWNFSSGQPLYWRVRNQSTNQLLAACFIPYKVSTAAANAPVSRTDITSPSASPTTVTPLPRQPGPRLFRLPPIFLQILQRLGFNISSF